MRVTRQLFRSGEPFIWLTGGALAFALVFNFSMYWFSDRIAIATTRSKPVTEQEQPAVYRENGAVVALRRAVALVSDVDAELAELTADALAQGESPAEAEAMLVPAT